MYKCVKENVYAVILVGGKGKRLRPVSAASTPKAFLPITKNDETMFGKTLDRVRKFIPPGRILVVANKRHADLVKKDFPDIRKENLILEPLSRNTAPAIALAASVIEKNHTDAIMLVLPSDHYITGQDKYINCLKKGVDFIRRFWWEDPFIVIGIKPCYPATGFGYIKLKSGTGKSSRCGVYAVERFVEKPSVEKARRFLKEGAYLWNSGMFIFKASSILKAIGKFMPAISSAVKRIGTVRIDTLYRALPNISIDYAVMEKARAIYCVKGTYGWQDMGNLNSLEDVLKKELKGCDKEPASMRILERLREMAW